MTVTLAALPAMDVAGRAGRLRPLLVDAGVDALLVTHLPNVRYLTGFTGSAAQLLVTRDSLVFTTDGRYRTQAAEQLRDAGVDAIVEIGATQTAQRDALAAALRPSTRLGLEAHAITWTQQRDLQLALSGHEIVPTTGLVEQLRRVKEPGEVARIRAACAIADGA
ncbi:MAG: aminopeptidase P family N-terminal domain-containing protein, partial [Acidimicrobiia bacterium]